MQRNRVLRTLLAMLALSTVAACGDGGSKGSTEPAGDGDQQMDVDRDGGPDGGHEPRLDATPGDGDGDGEGDGDGDGGGDEPDAGDEDACASNCPPSCENSCPSAGATHCELN